MSYYIDFLTQTDGKIDAAIAESEYDTVHEGVMETLNHWWEGQSNPQLYWLRDSETNEIVAVMHSRAGEETPSGGHTGLVSVTINTNKGLFNQQTYRVTYHVNAEGFYDHTEIHVV